MIDRFRQQLIYENEGGAAGLSGKTREDCPYDQTAQSEAWNFWVYGCENAQSEMRIMESGEITFSSTSDNDPVSFSISVDKAIESGMWKPKYVTLTKKSSL